MDVSGLIKTITSARGYEGQVVHVEDIASREPEYAHIDMNPLVKHALGKMGIKKLYSHQSEAVEKARTEI
jgi:DEAD/DEAH box helicase domain-containing protein